MKESAIDTSSFDTVLSSPFLIGNIGAPFVIGLSVGYFAKKMFRTVLFIGGGILTLLFIAEYYGVIDISDANLQSAATSITNTAKDSGSFLLDRVTSITSRGVSGAAGFFTGFKLG